MTRAEYAKHRGVEPNTVTKWKDRGLLVTQPDPNRRNGYLIDAVASDLKVERNVDPSAGRPTKAEVEGQAPAVREEAAPSEYEISRLALMKARTSRLEIDNAKSMGDLVRLSDYSQKVETLGRLIRERMHSLIRQNAEWLSSETDMHKIRRTLLNEVDELFDEVAKAVEDMEGDEARADEVLAQAEAEAGEEDDEP